MVSISSSTNIRERTLKFCNGISTWRMSEDLFKELNRYLKHEYDIVPKKERVGKGTVFICRNVAKEMVLFLKKELRFRKQIHCFGMDSGSIGY